MEVTRRMGVIANKLEGLTDLNLFQLVPRALLCNHPSPHLVLVKGPTPAPVTAPTPIPAPKTPQEQVLDLRYKDLVCFNCGDLGHFAGNCIKPKLCFICHGEHNINNCAAWAAPHPLATYFGSAAQGLGFFYIAVPNAWETAWMNFSNCGFVNIRIGSMSLIALEAKLTEFFWKVKKWPWKIREIDSKNYIVRFPP
uniref:Uncharacterized protein n=1 Tax=Avena sativa TaxID=4498 RepID=A0ACD5Z7C1_AVESA